MKTSLKQIAKRINGFSTPFGGISFNPSDSEYATAKKLLLFLEDRRVLYGELDMEVPRYVTDSVQSIREYLTNTLQSIDSDSSLISPLRQMRAACRKFLDTFDGTRAGYSEILIGLGEFRAIFGILIGKICVDYKLQCSSDLEKILPTEDTDKQGDK